MKRLKVLSWAKRAIRYIKTDFREIVLPSSLPNPPDYKPPRRLTWEEKRFVLKEATSEYLATWKPKPRPAPQDSDGDPDGRLFVEDLAAAARGGADTLRPYLGQLYQARMSSYQQAVSSFIQGYREGHAEGSKPNPAASEDGGAASSDAADGSSAFSATTDVSGTFSATVFSEEAGKEVSFSSGVAQPGASESSALPAAAMGGEVSDQGGKGAAAISLEQDSAADQPRGEHESIGIDQELQGDSEPQDGGSQESAVGQKKQT